MTKKEKQQATAAAVIVALLLLWKLASAKTPPKGKITVGPITVQDKERDQYDDGRERRALLRNKALDIIAFDEDRWVGTRKPSLADQIVLRTIFEELASIGKAIPDPEGYDAGFDTDLKVLVNDALKLPAATTASVEPRAFGSSRWMTRRLNIEEEIRDLVAMGKERQIRRRPSDAELAMIHSLVAEHARLRDNILSIDPDIESDMDDEPLEQIVATALGLPKSTSSLQARSEFIPGSYTQNA